MRSVAFRLMAVALGLAAVLVSLEVAFRILDIRPTRFITKRYLKSPEPLVSYFCYPSNPNQEFVPVPQLTGGPWQLKTLTLPPRDIPLERIRETPWCVDFSLSKQNLRDRLYGPPAPGVVRTAGIGDSFAVGEGVPLELSLFKQMERLLGEGYEFVNAGRPGFTLYDDLARWKEIAQFECRQAIVVFIANDISISPQMDKRQSYINDLINIRQEKLDAVYAGQASPSRLWDWCWMKVVLRGVTNDTVQWYLDLYSDANGNAVAQLEQTIRGFVKPDYPTVFVLYPLLEGLEKGYPLQPIHDLVGGMLRSAGIKYLDLAPVFAGQDTASLWVHPVDHHPNGKAHRMAAQAIIRWLRDEVPSFLEKPAATPPTEPDQDHSTG